MFEENQEESQKTLMEIIKEEKARRQKAKEIEEANFSVDMQEIIEEDDGLVSDLISNITDATPVHKKVVDMAEEFGMELKKINEDGDEVFVYKQYTMVLNPNKRTMAFNEVYDSGTVFNMHVHEVINSKLKEIKRDLVHALFLKGDVELKKEIQRNKEAFERANAKRLRD